MIEQYESKISALQIQIEVLRNTNNYLQLENTELKKKIVMQRRKVAFCWGFSLLVGLIYFTLLMCMKRDAMRNS